MREFRSSGSARDGGGNVPIYSAMTPFLSAGSGEAVPNQAAGPVANLRSGPAQPRPQPEQETALTLPFQLIFNGGRQRLSLWLIFGYS
jgi:hypothetical protein